LDKITPLNIKGLFNFLYRRGKRGGLKGAKEACVFFLVGVFYELVRRV